MGYLNVQGYARRAELVKGRSLLEHLRDLGVDINASCGGMGQCKQCLVQVNKSSMLSPMTDSEREFIRQPGFRLACQAYVVRDDDTVYWNNRELGVYEGELLGLSLDIGTTTLSMYCTDLETGEIS